MDEINRKILLMLLRDYNTSQRRIAKELNLSPPAVNYRIDRLISEGVIKKVSLYVNPNFYGKYHGYVSFSNVNSWEGEYVSKFTCLEKLTVYEIEGSSLQQLEDTISKMKEKLGESKMVYVPTQFPYKPSTFDVKLVSMLKENPTMDSLELAERMKVSSKTVRRHLRYLQSKGLLRLVPIVDVAKAGIVMFGIFTKSVEVTRKVLSPVMFREISDDKAGIFVSIAKDFEETKLYVDKVRKFDPDADVMITYSYEFSE
ncbi:MAG: winged helix-turn-helix transcriptional regulator [Candidatus Aramenus sp.]|jgi:DNA-binding Lrp family transcriptional regulator|nr:winged helix-turn-helix transcriptional regulator [Candidatus Aramenus sp.]